MSISQIPQKENPGTEGPGLESAFPGAGEGMMCGDQDMETNRLTQSPTASIMVAAQCRESRYLRKEGLNNICSRR